MGPVITWGVLSLWMEEQPADMEGSCECTVQYKQSRAADKGLYSSLGVGRVANNSHHKNLTVLTKHFTVPRIWTGSR